MGQAQLQISCSSFGMLQFFFFNNKLFFFEKARGALAHPGPPGSAPATESEESNTVPSLPEDPPSSSTPLLFKPFPSSPVHEEETPQQHPDQPPPDPTQYLQITYNYGPRPFKDLPFLILFLLFFVSTFAFGFFKKKSKKMEEEGSGKLPEAESSDEISESMYDLFSFSDDDDSSELVEEVNLSCPFKGEQT